MILNMSSGKWLTFSSDLCAKRCRITDVIVRRAGLQGRNKISSGGDLSHYSSASLY